LRVSAIYSAVIGMKFCTARMIGGVHRHHNDVPLASRRFMPSPFGEQAAILSPDAPSA
jgi:hypothetical protein